MARRLTEQAVSLIISAIQANLPAALGAVYSDRADSVVTMEPPPLESYFIFPKAHGYRCPAIFVVDDTMNFRQPEMKANHINALLKINVSVKVEDQDVERLVKKAWRYQAALHEVLDLTDLASEDGLVKLNVVVSRITPSGIYTADGPQTDEQANFYREYLLECSVNYWENF